MRIAHKSRRHIVPSLVGGLVLAVSLSISAVTPNEVQKLLGSDAAGNDWFGFAVAIDANTALIGAPTEESGTSGRDSGVYIFTRDQTGHWSESAKLTASDATKGDLFGWSVSLDQGTGLIGAFNGSAYVFTSDAAGNWSEQAKLTASDGLLRGQVSLDGNTAFARGFSSSETLLPAVYVFMSDAAGNWSEQAKIIASDTARLDEFGRAIALDGDTAIIGAPRADTDGLTDSGAAYVFKRDAAGDWNEQAKLTASDAASIDLFGGAVDLDGDTAIIGAKFADNNGLVNAGAVYVFERDGAGNWTEQAKLTASDPATSDIFGTSLALKGTTILIGASGADINGLWGAGAAYLFTRDGLGVWSEQAKLTASDAAQGAFFGGIYSDGISLSNNLALIGAPLAGGSAYVFDLSPPLIIAIDIKPSDGQNVVNLKSKGNIAVAILTTDTFDATQVDWESVSFGPDAATESHGRAHVQDVDVDGDMDMLLHFRIQETGIACGDMTATLVGETFGGDAITGADSVEIVNCPK